MHVVVEGIIILYNREFPVYLVFNFVACLFDLLVLIEALSPICSVNF